MANIDINTVKNTKLKIEFTQEEIDTLKKSSEIIESVWKDLSEQLLDEENDDVESAACFFVEMYESMNNILKGNYFLG